MTTYLFYFLSFLAILSGLMVIFEKNPIHSVLYLVITFFSIAGHYILLNAQFLFAVQIIVYAGAIMVLFLFVVMLLNLNVDNEPSRPALIKGTAVITSASMLVLILIAAARSSGSLTPARAADNSICLIQNLGQTLFNQYLMPFEISSLLFLSAMVGAIMLGKKEYK